jgi:hypothetical protein
MKHMKNIVKVIIFIFSLLSVVSCSSPYDNIGYGVDIRIEKNAKPTVNDMKLVADYLAETAHEVVFIKDFEWGRIESYKILLDKKKFKGIKRKYIRFVLECPFAEQKIDNKRVLKYMEIRIGNVWEGRKPILKKEIDLVADNFMINLEKRFGKSNLSVNREFETPM